MNLDTQSGELSKNNFQLLDLLSPKTRLLLTVPLLVFLATACGRTVEAGGVKVEFAGQDNAVPVEFDTGEMAPYKPDSLYFARYSEPLPNNIYLIDTDPSTLAELCNTDNQNTQLSARGCMKMIEDKYLIVTENTNDAKEEVTKIHEYMHAAGASLHLLDNLSNDEVENFARYKTLDYIAQDLAVSKGLDVSDREKLLDELYTSFILSETQINSTLDMQNPNTSEERFRIAMLDAAGIRPNVEISRYMLEYLVGRLGDETPRSFFDQAEFDGLSKYVCKMANISENEYFQLYSTASFQVNIP